MERLQKIISAAGVASRRKAEELITSGLVQVNGQTITELGAKADVGKDHIRVNGKLLKFSGHHVYILLNKPKGYVTTLSDPEGRPTVVDLLRGVKQRVYPVGRLDYASEGLLLLTNDGELANALTKTASHVPKTYLVKVSGQPSDAALKQLRDGIELPDRKGLHTRTAPAGIQLVHKAENPWYEVTLIEGRNRQVRAMFEQAGHHVEKLKRVRYGPFTLDVHPGEFRNLTPDEVEQLKAAVQRGASATPEAAVRPAARPIDRPIDHAARHLAAELREESTAAVSAPPAPSFREQPKRAPKPVGTFAAARGPARSRKPNNAFGKSPRQFSPRPAGAGAGGERSSGERSRGAGPASFRANDFRKKGPQKATFPSNRGESAPFQSRPREDQSRPVPRERMQKPAWSKSASLRPGPPTAAPRKWTQGAPSTGRPRAFDKSAPRPARASSSAPRPEWKRPGTAPRSGAASAPRKWTKPAGSAFAKPRAFDAGKNTNAENRAPRPDKDRWRNRPGAATSSPRRDAKPAFWQAADKRRPRKPKFEADAEQRPSKARDATEPRSQGGPRLRKPVARKPGPSTFKSDRPKKKRF